MTVDPRGATGVLRLRAFIGVSCLLIGQWAWGGQCVVRDPRFEAAPPDPPKVVPPMRIISGAHETSFMSGMRQEAPPGPEPVLSADQKRRNAVVATIGRRDLDAFRKLMPTDAGERQTLLRESYALSAAFGASCLPIVRQILEWDPGALQRPELETRKNRLLSNQASSWAHSELPRDTPQSTVKTPTADDYLELSRLLLDAGADANGASDSRAPIATLASMTVTPQTLAAARMILKHGASIEKTTSWPSPLAEAAEKQNVDVVRLMLEMRKPSQNALDEAIVKSPLLATNGVIPLLLERGANINVDPKKYGASNLPPAWLAASRVREQGGREFLQLLIRYKVDPNGVVKGTDSPLMKVMHDHELMKGLLDLGANTNYRTMQGEMPLHRAAQVPEQVTVDPGDTRPLKVAAPALDPVAKAKSVALLLQHGADPNGVNQSGMTPLMLTGADDDQVVELLLKSGGRVVLDQSREDDEPVGPISWALLNYKAALAQGLIARNSEISDDDCGAVFYAAQTGAARSLSLLLDRHASVDIKSRYGNLTPLLVAAQFGETSAVKTLLDRHAAKVDETSSVQVLLVPGHTTPPGAYGHQTALMLAAGAGHIDTVKELLRRGAKVDRRDAQRKTAADYASEKGHDDVVALLRSRY